MKLHWSQTLKNGQDYFKNNSLKNQTRYSFNITDINPLNMGHQAIFIKKNDRSNDSNRHQYLKKSRVLADMHNNNKVEPHSFITVVVIASIFLFSTMTITASLAVFCRKKNSVFVLQKCDQEDQEDIEMDENDTDTESDSESDRNYKKKIKKSNSDYVLVISPSKKASSLYEEKVPTCQYCSSKDNAGKKSCMSDDHSNYCSIVNGQIVESNKDKYDEITQLLSRCEMLNQCDGIVIDTFTHMQRKDSTSIDTTQEENHEIETNKKKKFKFKSKSNIDIVLENKHAVTPKVEKVQNSDHKEEKIYILKNSLSDHNEFLKKNHHIVLLKFPDRTIMSTLNVSEKSSTLIKPLTNESHTVDQATSPIVSLSSNDLLDTALETTKLLCSVENTSLNP